MVQVSHVPSPVVGAGVPAPEPPPFSFVIEKTPDPGAKPGRDRFPGPPRLFCRGTAPGAGDEAIVGGEDGGKGDAMLCCPFSGFGREGGGLLSLPLQGRGEGVLDGLLVSYETANYDASLSVRKGLVPFQYEIKSKNGNLCVKCRGALFRSHET